MQEFKMVFRDSKDVDPEEVGHKKSNLGAGQWRLAGSFVMTHIRWSQPDPWAKLHSTAENTGFIVLNWLRNVIKCASNYIPEPIKHTKTSVFCYPVEFWSGSGWDELLYVVTELPASFLRPVPRFDSLCMGACNVRPPLMLIQKGPNLLPT